MKDVKLGDIIDIKHGYAFDGKHIISDDNSIVLVTPGNFKIGGGFKEEKCKFFNGEIPKDYILHTGDYIVTMTDLSKTIDTLGYSAKIPNNSKRLYLHNQRIGLIKFKDDNVCKDYIYYVMQTSDYQKSIANTSSGAIVHHTSPTKICDYNLSLPPLSVQKKIAGILSCYDDLIENCHKQIALLEEAAARLYKKWFIKMEYPGSNGVMGADGLPKGWTRGTVGEVCSRISAGGTPSRRKASYWTPATIKWYKTGELRDCWLIDSEEHISEEGLDNSSAKLFPPNTILIAIYASPTLGRLGILSSEAACNQASLCLVANEKIVSWQWLYYKLFELRSEFNAVAKGAGQQNISAEVVKKKEIVLPPIEIITSFTNIVALFFDKIAILQKQASLLAEARDLLLPRLMSGEVVV